MVRTRRGWRLESGEEGARFLWHYYLGGYFVLLEVVCPPKRIKVKTPGLPIAKFATMARTHKPTSRFGCALLPALT